MFARKLEAGRTVGNSDVLNATAVLFVLALGLVGKAEMEEFEAMQLSMTGAINT